MTRRGLARALAAAGALACAAAQAGSPRLCDAGSDPGAAQRDRRLQLAALVKGELEASGERLALVARSGIDLERFGLRYSHAGVSLRGSPNTPWSVRQLYYDCDAERPRLFDQGLAGFLLATADARVAHVRLLLLPGAEAAALEAAALDTPRALQLLAGRYSANAYPFATRYQNCNQWLAELLAAAWGDLGPQPSRAAAQAWLRDAGYAPQVFEGFPLLFVLAPLVPLVHRDDHPPEDLEAARFRVSMPASVEDFVRRRLPALRTVELCQDERHTVLRRDGAPLDAGCTPADGDRVLPHGG